MHDLEVLRSLKEKMSGTTICLLSDFSITFLQSVLTHFADEFEAHVRGKACGVHSLEVRSA